MGSSSPTETLVAQHLQGGSLGNDVVDTAQRERRVIEQILKQFYNATEGTVAEQGQSSRENVGQGETGGATRVGQGQADKVLRVNTATGEYIEHLDFQAGPDTLLPQRLHWYNALLGYRHRLPVHSTVVLLRRQASLRTINGVYTERLAEGSEPYLHFHYQVIRLWQVPVEQVLTAGVSLLPLAGLCAVSPQDLPGVISRMQQRLDSEAEPQLAAELWTATDVLLGLLYDQAFIDQLLQGVRGMKESVTYQAILEEGRKKGLEQGRAEGIREVLLELGEEKFGSAAPEAIREQLTNLVAVAELERLSKRLLKVQSWADLLAPESAPAPRSRRKKST